LRRLRVIMIVLAAAAFGAAACQDNSTGCCLVCNGSCPCGDTCIACSAKCTQPKGCACTAGPTPEAPSSSLAPAASRYALPQSADASQAR
jgi:hypothetical protein